MRTFQFICEQFLSDCRNNIQNNTVIISFLEGLKLYDKDLIKEFKIGFSRGKTPDDHFNHSLILPLFENDKFINIVGYNILNHPSQTFTSFNNSGIFNVNELFGKKEIIFTDNPIDTMHFIQQGFLNTTFVFGDYDKYISLFRESNTDTIISTFYGHSELFANLSKLGLLIKQTGIDSNKTQSLHAKEYLATVINKAVPIYFEKNITFHLN